MTTTERLGVAGLKVERPGNDPLPSVFVSVASKGVSFPAKPLESTLVGTLVSVADKRLSGE
jgi:hypothetical protein